MIYAQTGERTWIDEAADRFEHGCKTGGDRPRIEDFLAQEAGPRRILLLQELMRVECELRKRAGETPLREEYRQRFPDDRASVEAVFGDDGNRDPQSKPREDAAQSLLFGLLALQNNFIDRETLLAAFNAWVADKSQSIGQILLDRGALTPARHAVLQTLVHEHLQQHGFDPERSLADVAVVPAVRDDLEALSDFDLQASLLYLRLAAINVDDETDNERTSSWDEESAATDAEGRFRIVRFHDRGALGEVYVARDQQLHRIVALKRIKRDHATDRDKRARFVVEAEVTGRLEHPGIVPVYGLGTYDDGRPFYAMRFIRGDNLKSAIEQFHQAEEKGRDPGERNLALLKLLRRFLDVCNAIDYAHSRGVLHRDLKPGNIMLGKFGETLVVDWGLAKSVGRPEAAPASATMDDRTLIPQSGSDLRGTELGARLGTPAYMSPEQAAGRIADLGPASDVYSLGATLYSLLTGRTPFNDPDLAELLRQVERGDFTPPRKLKGWVDPALDAICLKAMATEPARRYRTPRALADDVEHWLADEPVSAWREPVRRRMRRWGRRHRLLVTSLGATLVVALAALVAGNVLVARQRDRAVRSLAFARNVVDEMYVGVADKLDDQEQMDDYQREILEKALAFYERFAIPQSRDPQIALEAVTAGLRVGAIRRRLGRREASEHAYRRALAVLSGLVSPYRAEPVYRDALAEVHDGLGRVFHDEQRWVECEREFKRAAAIWDALAREHPETADYRSKLVDAKGDLGDMYTDQDRYDEAEAVLRDAMDAAERLATENPEVDVYQASLARILVYCGGLKSVHYDLSGSEEAYERAAMIQTRLVRKRPEATKYLYSLARTQVGIGNSLASAKKFSRAEVALKESIAIMEKLAAGHPLDTRFTRVLARSYYFMQDCRLLQGDLESAVVWSGRAVSLSRSLVRQDPDDLQGARRRLWFSLVGHAETLTRLGRHAEAIAEFEETLQIPESTKSGELLQAFLALAKARLGDSSMLAHMGRPIREALEQGTSPKGADYYMTGYDAACVHVALAKLAIDDQQAPLAERQRRAQRDLDRALELLDKARATGEFKGAIRLDEIRREPLLDLLRNHPRFQLLMMDLVFPDCPVGPGSYQDKKASGSH